MPADKIIAVLQAVTRRTPFKINSFKYFLKEIQAKPDPRNRAWQKRQLAQIVSRIRDNTVGSAEYTGSDFLKNVKLACARQGIDSLIGRFTRFDFRATDFEDTHDDWLYLIQ
jgi:hypothetical protein